MQTKAEHDRHLATYEEDLAREKSARQGMDQLLAKEKAEREKHHVTIVERVDSLERSASIFDGLVQEERKEHMKAHERLWDAVDNHTHDLSGTIQELRPTPRMAPQPSI